MLDLCLGTISDNNSKQETANSKEIKNIVLQKKKFKKNQNYLKKIKKTYPPKKIKSKIENQF